MDKYIKKFKSWFDESKKETKKSYSKTKTTLYCSKYFSKYKLENLQNVAKKYGIPYAGKNKAELCIVLSKFFKQ